MAAVAEPILAVGVETTPDALIVRTADEVYAIVWSKCSERLARATADERLFVELSPSGYGLHWPLLDEDLAVGPLVRSVRDAA
jgi:hypothetical protein